MLELTYAVLALVHCAPRLESRRVQLRRGWAILVRRRMQPYDRVLRVTGCIL